MLRKKVIIVGGFCEIFELCEDLNFEIEGIFDLNENNALHYKYLGTDKEAVKLHTLYKNIPVVITPDNPIKRKLLSDYYRKIGYISLNLISPKAILSPSITLGEGIVIQAGVSISSKTVIGSFVKINTRANITHECIVNDFSTIAPSAVLLGRVVIGNNCYIGANSTILPGIVIGDNTIVGAGAVVTRNVMPHSTVKGVPAK